MGEGGAEGADLTKSSNSGRKYRKVEKEKVLLFILETNICAKLPLHHVFRMSVRIEHFSINILPFAQKLFCLVVFWRINRWWCYGVDFVLQWLPNFR